MSNDRNQGAPASGVSVRVKLGGPIRQNKLFYFVSHDRTS